jgi:hypothetical protein
VDLFEQLRREHEFGIGTIAGVAAKFGVHRRVVRQALSGALPPQHHYPERSKPKLGRLAPGASRAYMGQTGLQHSLGLRVGGLHQLFLLTRNRP